MTREYHKWFSPHLGRDMELLLFGHGGHPVLVFPTAKGRFYDYEERKLIDAVRSQYESGVLQAFCVDSVDSESWSNTAIPPAQRALRHIQYERYLLDEVLPFIKVRNTASRIAVTGCNFGGYHAANFAFRHPKLVSHCVSLGGTFNVHQLLNGYSDENCYFHCPPTFLPGLEDETILSQFRNHVRFVFAAGETDPCIVENRHLSKILSSKHIPHWLDVWGAGTGHDGHWWQQMTVKFFG